MTGTASEMGETLRPAAWSEAVALRSERPDLDVIAGGTDVMVEVNFGRRRPVGLLDLTRVADPDVAGWSVADGTVVIGAGVTWTQVLTDLADVLPGLAMAARTVGSPQIRNRGTLAGNLASASPAGDGHPPLLAAGASVELESVSGRRLVPIAEFFLAPKRSALASDELVRAVHVPVAAGPQQFSKVGTRNAMVIAVTSFAVALDLPGRRVGTGIGSAGPTPLRATAAEELAAESLPWESAGPVPVDVVRRFGELVAEAASPIDDVRGTAAYRRNALAVMARRTLSWAWAEHTSREAGR